MVVLGKIKKEVYSFYLQQFSCGQMAPLIAFFALSQLSTFAMDVFLSRWAVGDTSLLLVRFLTIPLTRSSPNPHLTLT